MKQTAIKRKLFEPKIPEPPSVGQSLIEIAQLIGRDFNYTKTLAKQGERRQFKDEKGYFREMSDKKKKGEKTIAE